MRKIRVLHIMEERQFGGAYTVVTTLIKGMNPDRFETILCMLGRNPHFTERSKFPCEAVHCKMNGTWDLFSIMRLKKVIQRHEVDIVHTHLPRADVIGRTATTGKNPGHLYYNPRS